MDGAHVPGSIPSKHISIRTVSPTFYVVTFHKWANGVRPSGGMWVNREEIEEGGLGYGEFIDLSRLCAEGGWGLGDDRRSSYSKGSAESEESSSSSSSSVNGSSLPPLYVDGKPGILTDTLTQGVYDESTRDYDALLCLPLCLDLVEKFEGRLQVSCQRSRDRGTVLKNERREFGIDGGI